MATRNKLPYLREASKRLFDNARADEEIVIVDGASTDGSAEFLADLHRTGRIHQFLSEPDKGEGHALNKAILMSRGDLIKVVTDDDVFNYPAIRACKQFMLENPDVLVLSGKSCNLLVEHPEDIQIIWEFDAAFHRWRDALDRPFFFNGLPLMIRRNGLSLVGLLHSGLVCVDLEFSLRVTTLTDVAWCLAPVALRVENRHSNYRRLTERCAEERMRVAEFYRWESGDLTAPDQTATVPGLRSRLGSLKRRLVRRLLHAAASGPASPVPTAPSTGDAVDLSAAPTPSRAFEVCEAWLAKANKESSPTILTRTRADSAKRGRIGMIPDPFGPAWRETRRNPHSQLLAESIEADGFDVVGIEHSGVWPTRDEILSNAPDVLHVHWPTSLFDLDRWRQRRGHSRRVDEAELRSKVHSCIEGMKSLRVPLVWEVHDIRTQAFKDTALAAADEYLHHSIFEAADGVVLHEESCCDPVFAEFGGPKPHAIAPLGDYTIAYGMPRTKEEARSSLGIPRDNKVLAHIDIDRSNRNPSGTLDSFKRRKHKCETLICAGQGLRQFLGKDVPDNVVVLDRLLRPTSVRDMVCAADFVISDARESLTSAVVRAAMSYERPVIAYGFGSTVDMARGASILIPEGPFGLDEALDIALGATSEDYSDMVEAARARNRERTWRAGGEACVSLYRRLLR